MPFKSEKQRRFLWAAHPEIAKRWAHEYPESNKGLPMYKKDSDEKKAALGALERALGVKVSSIGFTDVNITNFDTLKAANSGMVKVDLKHSDKPTYAGEEREKGELDEEGNPKSDGRPVGTGPEAVSAIFGKLSAVLARPLREAMEAQKALEEGREPMFVPQNLNVRRYSIPSPGIAPPMGMTAPTVAQPTPQPVQQPGQASINSGNSSAVGGGSNPQHNPIQAFGPLGAKGQLNGNAAFGVKNSPDSLKTAAIKAALGGNKLPAWYGAEGLIEGQDGHYRYGVHHGVGIRDQAPGFLSRLFSRSPYVLRDDVPKYKKRLKQIKGLQVYEDPDELHFSHSGTLRPETRQLIEAALAKHASAKISNPVTASPSILDDQEEKISVEVQQGGLPARVLASTVGHVIGFPMNPILTLKTHQNPSNWRGAGNSLFTSQIAPDDLRAQSMNALAQSMAAARPQELSNTRVYLGGPRLSSELYRGLTNPRTSLLGKALSTIATPVAATMSAVGRSNAYNPYTDSVYQYGNTPAVLSHELGHAIDFNKAPVAKTMLGRQWQGLKRDAHGLMNAIPGLQLRTEAAANRESLKAIQESLKSKPAELQKLLHERQQVLPAGFASYLGGNALGLVHRAHQGSTALAKMIPELAPRLAPIAKATGWAGKAALPVAIGSAGLGKLYGMVQAARGKTAAETPAWQRAAGKNDAGGLNEKGRKSYEREHGGDLKAPVTESNPSGERAKRQNSFCSRMCGMKRVNTGAKTKSDPDSRINKSLRKWNCKCASAETLVSIALGADS